MPNVKRIFLTGATGFLGCHVARALLDHGHGVMALVRKTSSQTPRQRLLDILARVSPPRQDFSGLEVLEGDISAPLLGLTPATYEEVGKTVDEVWHCAASLSFLEDDRDDIFRMNVDGTRHVLELTQRIRGKRLHHVSTAYVAGDRTGVVFEDDLDAGQGFRNPYEESKFEAEVLLRSANQTGVVRSTIYRPSVVIGRSDSGEATHFHGVYAFIRGLWTLARRLHRGSPESTVVRLPLRILGSESSTLNFVPVDFVTDAILELARRDSSACRTFHLTNPEPTPNRVWMEIICRQLGIEGVRLAEAESFREEAMTRVETLFHRQMTFFSPYLSSEPVFDCSATLEGLRETHIRCPEVTAEFTARVTGWYIDLLNGASSG